MVGRKDTMTRQRYVIQRISDKAFFNAIVEDFGPLSLATPFESVTIAGDVIDGGTVTVEFAEDRAMIVALDDHLEMLYSDLGGDATVVEFGIGEVDDHKLPRVGWTAPDGSGVTAIATWRDDGTIDVTVSTFDVNGRLVEADTRMKVRS